MRVIFFNCQRSVYDFEDTLIQDVVGLAGRRPDILVLCEALQGLEQRLEGQCPPYEIQPAEGKSLGPTTLRYITLRRPDLAVAAQLVAEGSINNGKDKRGGLALTITAPPAPARRLLAMHAPAVSGQYKPQADAVADAIRVATGTDMWNDWLPEIVFGDLNVNYEEFVLRTKFLQELYALTTVRFSPLAPAEATHRTATTGIFDTKLDWCVHLPGSHGARVETITESGGLTSRYGIVWPRDGGSDDEFAPSFTGNKGSDHRPIEITLP